MIAKKKIGRPRKFGKRTTLTVRLTDAMHAVVRDRANNSGRSMSEEIELTLEKVFFPLPLILQEFAK